VRPIYPANAFDACEKHAVTTLLPGVIPRTRGIRDRATTNALHTLMAVLDGILVRRSAVILYEQARTRGQ
jgi:hypothetical protein